MSESEENPPVEIDEPPTSGRGRPSMVVMAEWLLGSKKSGFTRSSMASLIQRSKALGPQWPSKALR